MVIKLYIDYGSQPARACLALCILNNIPHQVVETRLFKGENRTPEYKKINPMKLVPALQDTDAGLCLAESHAIMRYLCAKFRLDEQWYPQQDLVKQAKINEYLDFHHQRTRKCAYLVFHLLFAPILKTGDPTFQEKNTRTVIESSLRYLEKLYLKGKFIGGDKPCIADLAAYYQVTMLQVLDFDYSPYPTLVKWIGEMRKIEGVNKANEKFMKGMPKLKQLRQPAPKL